MNKTFLNILYMLFFITSCNNVNSEKKNDISSDKIDSDDITKESRIKKDDAATNNEALQKIFSIKEGQVYINCKYINDNDLSIKQKLFDIELIKEGDVKNMISINESSSNYFSKIIGSPNAKSFYYSSSIFFPCSAIIYFEHETETSSLYLFQFNEEGKFIDKFLLSEKNLMPGAISKKFSEITGVDNAALKVTFVENMMDEYVDENNFSELIDSIVSNYNLEKGKLQLKSKDSTRHKVEVKK